MPVDGGAAGLALRPSEQIGVTGTKSVANDATQLAVDVDHPLVFDTNRANPGQPCGGYERHMRIFVKRSLLAVTASQRYSTAERMEYKGDQKLVRGIPGHDQRAC